MAQTALNMNINVEPLFMIDNRDVFLCHKLMSCDKLCRTIMYHVNKS
jgi:hypothetical protein